MMLVKKITMGVGMLGLTAMMTINAQTLVYCSEASPESFNPQLVSSGTSFDASAIPVYNRLVEFTLGTTEVGPSLAESWEVSADNLTYTFHLRKDVKWQKNREFKPTRNFTADDVVFSFERQKNPDHPYHKVSGRQYEYFESMGFNTLISEIKKIDEYTVAFKLTRPESPFIANMAMPFASILSAEYGEAMLKAGTPEKMDLKPIGTGPFTFRQYQQDSRILFEANQEYWGTKAKVNRLVFSITPDPAVRYAKLQKGECHIMPFPNLADLPQMKDDPNIVVKEQTGINIGYVAYNMNKKPLDKVEVRQALTMAVNKADIIAAIYQGAGEAATNLIPSTMWGYNTEIKDYPYDPEGAKALLKKVGLDKGFEIDLWAMPVQRPYNPNARRMAEMIQADWKEIGVKTNIVTYEWGEYLNRIRDGEHDTVTIGWTGDNGDPDNFFGVLMSCVAAKAGSNYSNWCSKPFDELLDEARQTSDHEQRVELYKKAQVIMHDEVPALMVAHAIVYMPMRKEVKGYIMDPLGLHHFDQVELVK